jgi:hypothetical protein
MGLAGFCSRSAGLRIAVALLPPDPAAVPRPGSGGAWDGATACIPWRTTGRVCAVDRVGSGDLSTAGAGRRGCGGRWAPRAGGRAAAWRSAAAGAVAVDAHGLASESAASHASMSGLSRDRCGAPPAPPSQVADPGEQAVQGRLVVERAGDGGRAGLVARCCAGPRTRPTSRCPARPGRGARSSPVARQASHLHSAGRMAWSQPGVARAGAWTSGERRAARLETRRVESSRLV